MLLYSIPALFISFVLSLCILSVSFAFPPLCSRLLAFVVVIVAVAVVAAVVVVFFSSFPLEFLYVSFYFELYFLLALQRCFCAKFSYNNNTMSICRLSVVRSVGLNTLLYCMLCACVSVSLCVCLCMYFSSLDSIRKPWRWLLPHILCHCVSLVRSFACSLSLGNVCLCLFFLFHSIRRFSFHYTTMTA